MVWGIPEARWNGAPQLFGIPTVFGASANNRRRLHSSCVQVCRECFQDRLLSEATIATKLCSVVGKSLRIIALILNQVKKPHKVTKSSERVHVLDERFSSRKRSMANPGHCGVRKAKP